MIKAFLRNIPIGRKFILLIGMTAFFLIVSTLFGMLLSVLFYGNDILLQLTNPNLSDLRIVAALKVMQTVNMAGGLLLPAILYLYFTEDYPLSYSKLRKLPSIYPLILTLLFVLALQPFIGYLGDLNSRMHLSGFMSSAENWMKNAEEQAMKLSKAFLTTGSIGGLWVNIFMIALLPAVTEELLFRGIVARLFRKMTGSIHWAAILSAVLFAAIHMQFYGFLPRFLLGLVFAYMLFRTGNLWIPVAAHFINNLLSVLADFLFGKGYSPVSSEQLGTTTNPWIIIASLVGSSLLFLMLWRNSNAVSMELSPDQESQA